ncbi:MAG: hypothetical protein C4346_18605 [Chloroflexota bacterium]
MITRRARLYWFVTAVVVSAAAVMALAWTRRAPFPGWLPVGTLLVIATLLEGPLATRVRIAGAGSIAFVIHLSAVLLFGFFWGAGISACAMLLGNIARRNTPIKTSFNAGQIVLAIFGGVAVYSALGGHLPPLYLAASADSSSPLVQRDFGLFFVLAASYFVLNAAAVSVAVSLGSERAFREVWRANSGGVLGYDLAASVLAVAMAWLYVRLDQTIGFGSAGIAILMLPMIAVRHVYGLYRRLQEGSHELLEVMVKAIEARDQYTSGHSVRVGRLSRTLAVELGLSAKAIQQIETAALLHDVGKIHEEFAPLLRKESRLTHEETAVMQTHAARSADLVAIISKFHGPVEDAVRHHHERWDGKGYPDGLAGEEIPIAARIILIADTIDAMTTDRPYRRRLPVEAVLAELQKYKGSQFDPRLVDVVTSSVAMRRLIAEQAAPAPAVPQLVNSVAT